jgi:predicted sugar kinase
VEEIIKQACQLSLQDRQRLVKEVEASLVKEVVKSRPARKDSWATQMRQVLGEFRKGAAGYSAEAIDQIVDEAVAAVRSGKQPRKGKTRADVADRGRHQRFR